MRTGTIPRSRASTPLERLFEEEGERLWRAVLAFTGGRVVIADDAVAEAFARALAREPEVRVPVAWLYRVAINVAVDEVRRERRQLDAVQDETLVEPSLRSDEVWVALRSLPEHQRLAVVLRYEMDLDVAEIAARMAIAPATVRVHLFRARRRLREVLGGEDDG